MNGKPNSLGTVLVVDDEASIRDSLRMILEFEGYKVEEAANGVQALVRVAEKAPDAILLDIKMPEMDGMTALTAMRERGYEMPVLVVSGHADVQTAVEATRRGAFDFFEKPLHRDRVLVSLRNAVEAWRLRTENRVMRHEPDELVGSSPAMERLARDDRPRRADPGDGAGHRRKRHRQGAGGAGDPPPEPAARQTFRAGQLRGDPGRADRVRAVRPREGQLHRRHAQAGGQIRGGARRHDFPRRDRRHVGRAPRPRFCGPCRAARSSRSARRVRCGSTCGWSPPPTATCRPTSRPAAFARTFSTA